MIRVRRIELAGFRATFGALAVDLGAKCQSIAIFGENATGKSSIADAIEWFYTDRVDHLWKENCKEAALRNTLLANTESSTVTLSFNVNTLNSGKTLLPSYASSFSNKSQDFQVYMAEIYKGQERLILRNHDLLSFVVSTKTEKRQYLAKIIGYEALDEFREVLSRTQTKLEGTPDYVAATRNAPEFQKECFKLAGTQISTLKELFAAGERLISSLGLSITIGDDQAYRNAINEISNKLGDTEKAAKQLVFRAAKDECDALGKKISEVTQSYAEFTALYSQLLQSEEEIRQIKLESFLSMGANAIENRLSAPDTCPLCLQPIPWSSLKSAVANRIQKLLESKKKYSRAFSQRATALSNLENVIQVALNLASKSAKTGSDAVFISTVNEYLLAAKDLREHIREDFERFRPITTQLGSHEPIIAAALRKESDRVKGEADALALTREEQDLLNLVRNLGLLRTAFLRYADSTKSKRRFDDQIRTLSKVRTEFNRLHSTTLQSALDRMSGDISRYYLAMHPHENVDDIKLTVLDEGVEFKYSFHGKESYPPLKYLSESHLNSLGIAVFLASAKLFNKVNGYFVLDDIVSSFDSNHRLRLLHLLRSEFSEWQIILLTHEPFWFEMIKKEMLSQGWLISELELSSDVGVLTCPPFLVQS